MPSVTSQFVASSSPRPSISKWKTVDPGLLRLPHEEKANVTVADLSNFMKELVDSKVPTFILVVYLIGVVACLLSAVLCAFLLFKKRKSGSYWLFKLSRKRCGTFVVPNSFLIFVLLIFLYLISWIVFTIFMTIRVFQKTSFWEWHRITPLPWLPLVVGAWFSVYGFILSFSPESPVSTIKLSKRASHEWIHLAVPHEARLMNTILFSVPIALTSVTIWAVVYQYKTFQNAINLQASLPSTLFKPTDLTDNISQLASPELIWSCKLIWAAYLDMYRYHIYVLVSFEVVALLTWILTLLYGVPNLINLVYHAYEMFPGNAPQDDVPFRRKIWFLFTAGRPRHGNPLYETAWRSVVMFFSHIALLGVMIPVFALIDILLPLLVWDALSEKGKGGQVLFLFFFFITFSNVIAGAYLSAFCATVTFDPLYRAVVGLNFQRASTLPSLAAMTNMKPSSSIDKSLKHPVLEPNLDSTVDIVQIVQRSNSNKSDGKVSADTHTSQCTFVDIPATAPIVRIEAASSKTGEVEVEQVAPRGPLEQDTQQVEKEAPRKQHPLPSPRPRTAAEGGKPRPHPLPPRRPRTAGEGEKPTSLLDALMEIRE